MADKTEAHRQADEREAKAAMINEEVQRRLHQNDVQPGITAKPAPKAPKAAKSDTP